MWISYSIARYKLGGCGWGVVWDTQSAYKLLNSTSVNTDPSKIGNSISWPHPLASMEIPSRWCLTMLTRDYCGFPRFSCLHDCCNRTSWKSSPWSQQLQLRVDENPNRVEKHSIKNTCVHLDGPMCITPFRCIYEILVFSFQSLSLTPQKPISLWDRVPPLHCRSSR